VHIIADSQGSSAKQVGYFSPRWFRVIFFREHLRKILWLKTVPNVAHAVQASPSIQSQAYLVPSSTFSHFLGIFRNMQHNSLRALIWKRCNGGLQQNMSV